MVPRNCLVPRARILICEAGPFHWAQEKRQIKGKFGKQLWLKVGAAGDQTLFLVSTTLEEAFG